MNNNVLKSVFFAAVVLVAGIVAMQVVYNNVADTDGEGFGSIAPAAGGAFGDAIDGAKNAL